MFKYSYFKTRHGSYLRNEHGIKKFAEMSMGQLIRRVTKKSAFYREMNENLLVEKANLRLRLSELTEKPALDAGEFFSLRRRLLANTVMVVAIVAAAIFLYTSALVTVLEAGGTIAPLLVWTVAILLGVVLAGAGVVITDRLIAAFTPQAGPRTEQLRDGNRSLGALWGVLLAGVLVTIVGVGQVQANILTEATGNTFLYFSFILISLLLPLMAGALRWDVMRCIDVYKTTQGIRQIESRLGQIDSILRQNEEYESNYYKVLSISYWDNVNEFKTFKDNYNAKKGIVEDISGHFSQTYDQFQAEANKRYETDIRDITSRSIRKLEIVEGRRGTGKLGQDKKPVMARRDSGGSDGESKPVYLDPKPIR
jgi:hypothetical protein